MQKGREILRLVLDRFVVVDIGYVEALRPVAFIVQRIVPILGLDKLVLYPGFVGTIVQQSPYVVANGVVPKAVGKTYINDQLKSAIVMLT